LGRAGSSQLSKLRVQSVGSGHESKPPSLVGSGRFADRPLSGVWSVESRPKTKSGRGVVEDLQIQYNKINL